jgi:hypothetical protein
MEAKTVEVFPLVVGESGVPYLLGDLPGVGHRILNCFVIFDLTNQ